MWWGKMFASLILAPTLEIQTDQGALAKAGPGQWPQLCLGSTFCLSASCAIAPGPAVQFLSSLARQLSEQEKGVCAHTNRGTQREEINAEWEGESPKDWHRCAIQGPEGNLCSLSYSLVFQTWDAVSGCHPTFSFIIQQGTKTKTEKWWKKGSLKNTSFSIAFIFQFLFITYFQAKAQCFLCPTKE